MNHQKVKLNYVSVMESPYSVELAENFYNGIKFLTSWIFAGGIDSMLRLKKIPISLFFLISVKTISDETKKKGLREKVQPLEVHIILFMIGRLRKGEDLNLFNITSYKYGYHVNKKTFDTSSLIDVLSKLV